jgi:hypothetical protein
MASISASTVGLGVVVVAVVLGAAVAGHRVGGDAIPELAAPIREVAPGLIRLDGPEGQRLLFESEAHAAFLPLVSHFETQRSPTHCGPASIAMVLNALEVPAPAYDGHRLFTQHNLELTDPIVSDREIERRGMSLAEVAAVMEVYGASVDLRYASASSVDEFRRLAVEQLGNPGRHVLVNYSRSGLGQAGPGHASPLGAYDADSDRFLILDVSRYKAPAVWVTTEQLFGAMAEPRAPGSTRSRGFLLVRRRSDGERRDAAPPP